jgi:hypothetical protein
MNFNFVIPGLTRNPAINNTGALCAPLDTGLRRYDGVSVYMPDQYAFLSAWKAKLHSDALHWRLSQG